MNCKNLKKLQKFKSELIYEHDGKSYHIEDYQLGSRGKLIVRVGNTMNEYFFESINGTISVLTYERKCENQVLNTWCVCNTNFREFQQIIIPLNKIVSHTGDINRCDRLTISDKMLVKQLGHFAFYDKTSGIFGPSALYQFVQRKAEVSY